MKQMQKAQASQSEMQEKLEATHVEGQAGGGMVKANCSGTGQITKLQIDKMVVDPNDIEAMEDLILAAIKDAQNKANEMQQAEMQKMMSGLSLPGSR